MVPAIIQAMAEKPDLDLGAAGSSGRREYERRQATREARTRARHPHIGGLLLALQSTPEHEKAWATGAAGEEELAAFLVRRCPKAIVLHDRRMPGSRANIDHLAVAPSGVWVIDAKRYKGRIEVRKPWFRDAKLVIGGRDKSKLVDGLARQAEAVQSALGLVAPGVPMHACFCFVPPEGEATKLPLLWTLTISGYSLLYPRKLTKRLKQPGELSAEQMRLVAEGLAQKFLAA
jgi:hypothetical protein